MIPSGEIDPNILSEATMKLHSSSPHTCYLEPTHGVSLGPVNDEVDIALTLLLSSNQYKPREQFCDDERGIMSIPLSSEYDDKDIKQSMIPVDKLGDHINNRYVRVHCSSSNLGIDLFNNAAILPNEHFVSPFDNIEMRVYSVYPTTYVMICPDIRKSSSLCRQCVNLANGAMNMMVATHAANFLPR